VQNKFVGTGHVDMSKFEWVSSQHRDSIASHVGHSDMLNFFAVAQNDSIGRVRYQLLEVSLYSLPSFLLCFWDCVLFYFNLLSSYYQKMLQPCGPPPARDEDNEPDPS
jgi:splicing factor 3B subunit 5